MSDETPPPDVTKQEYRVLETLTLVVSTRCGVEALGFRDEGTGREFPVTKADAWMLCKLLGRFAEGA